MNFISSMAIFVLVAGLSGTAAAQMPFPFGGQPQPELGKMPKCTKDYVKSVETQIVAMEKLRASGPEFMGGELPDSVRQQLKGMLGVDIDLRFIKTQCRVSQGNLDREVMSQIGFLKAELVRCGDTI